MKKDIDRFVSSLDSENFNYLKQVVNIVIMLKRIFELSGYNKIEFCEIMKIKPEKFKRYISGNYDYRVYDLALIENALYHFQEKNLKESIKVKVKLGKDDERIK